MKKAKESASSLRDQISLLSDLVETIKLDCTKAYKNGMGFVISSLKTEVEKLNLTVPYFTLMIAF